MHIDPDTRDTIVTITVVLGFIAAFITGMWRLWLKPFLQRELIEPMHESRDDGKVIRDHVANTHETNLREDMDRQSEMLETTASAVFRLQVDLSALAAATARVEDRLADGDERFDAQDAQLAELKRLAAQHHPGE